MNQPTNAQIAAVAAAAPSRPGGVNSRPAAASNVSTIPNGNSNDNSNAAVTVAPSAHGFPLTGVAPAPPLPPFSGDTVAAYAASAATPAQRCSAADIDMGRCLSITDKITALEIQASVACTQCDQIRKQIADLRKQIAAPVAAALTGPALRYGGDTKVGVKLSLSNTNTVCKEKLPALMGLSPEGDIVTANYTDKIKPLVDILSKNSRPSVKALRDELKSYDPPGAFMRTFGRKAKAKSGLKAVAGRVSTAVGCPVPGGLRINAPPKLPSPPAMAGIGQNKDYYGMGGGARRRKTHGRRRNSRKTAKK